MGEQFNERMRQAQKSGGSAQAPEAWVGQDVLVLLAVDAIQDIVPEARPDLELTLGLEEVGSYGALLTQHFREPGRGSAATGSVFYPWSSIKRIRPMQQ